MAYSPKTNWANNDIVRPSDLNRMEQGIADNDTGKAAKNLSNVSTADFAELAKRAGISSTPTSATTLYVATGGNDTTGDGTSSKPFATIQKAVQSLPTSNDLNVDYTINIAAGNYAGFTLNANKNISIVIQGNVTFTSDVLIKAGSIDISGALNRTIRFQNCRLFVQGGKLKVSTPLTFAEYPTIGTTAAIECINNSMVHIDASVSIGSIITGVTCIGSIVSIRQITTTSIRNGVISQGGVVYIGEETITATSKFVSTYGGRIYLGTQQNIPNY